MSKHSIIALVTGVICLCLSLNSAWGADDTTEGGKAPDVRVVIDISGSMKQNDPKNLRKPALELLVQSLPDDSRSGVWTFGQYVNMMVSHKPVTDKWRQGAMGKAGEINSVGLFTNIGAAMEKSAYDLHYDNENTKYDTHVILLTDGMVDIDRDPEVNLQERRRIIDSVLPTLKGADYTIHTVSLSDNADRDLMRKLAQSTDGVFEIAHSADDLMKIFMRVLNQAAPAEEVPLNNNRFLVDSSVEEFTALVFTTPDAAPTQLRGPDGSRYSFEKEREDVNWYRTESYDLITVKQPLEGEWQLLADIDPENRVAIISDLQLKAKPLKNNVEPNEPALLSLALMEGGKPIDNKQLLSLVDIQVSMVHEQTGAQVFSTTGAFDGTARYTEMLYGLEEEGNYQLDVSVDGKSFQRRFKHRFAVVRPFAVDLVKDEDSALPRWVATVSGFTDNLNLEKTSVMGSIRTPNGKVSVKPFSMTEMDNWQLAIEPQAEGEYSIDIRVTAVSDDGQSNQLTLAPQRFTYPDDFDPFTPSASEPKPEPKPEAQEPEPQEPEPKELEPIESPPEEGGSDTLLYIGLGVGNLLILILGFAAYRLISKDESVEDEDIEELGEAEAPEQPLAMAQIEPAAKEKPEEESEPEPVEEPADAAAMVDVDDDDDEFSLDGGDEPEAESTDDGPVLDLGGMADIDDDENDIDVDALVAEASEALPESSEEASEQVDESILDEDEFALDDDFDGDEDLSEFSLDDFEEDFGEDDESK